MSDEACWFVEKVSVFRCGGKMSFFQHAFRNTKESERLPEASQCAEISVLYNELYQTSYGIEHKRDVTR